MNAKGGESTRDRGEDRLGEVMEMACGILWIGQ